MAFGQHVFMGLFAQDPLRAKEIIPILKDILSQVPGIIPIVKQTSLFEQGRGAGRSIDVDISGPELPVLVAKGERIFERIRNLIPDAQLQPVPSLDLGNPEVRILPDRDQASKVGLTAQEIGINVQAMLDGIKVGEVRRFGDKIDLTHLEFRLVRLLTSRPGYVFTNDEIIRAVWGSKGENDQTALKNVIYRLRKKLGNKREYMIQTSPGGYSFRED